MLNNKPNIFEFATKELSQDAIFCYILDCFNSTEKRNIATEFLKLIEFSFIDEIKEIKIKQQEDHSDIKAIVSLNDNTKKIIVIEDKVFSSLHDNQLERYMNAIKKREGCTDNDIFGVFFKIGKQTIWEKKLCEASKFKNLDYSDFAKYIENVSKNDFLLESFSEFFKQRVSFYEMIDTLDFDNIDGDMFDGILSDRYGQRKFTEWVLRQVFENTDSKYNEKKQYDVNNYGRPCTQYTFIFNINKTSPDKWDLSSDEFPTRDYTCFFRIDKNKNGWYIAIRQYFHDGADEYESEKSETKRHTILEKLSIQNDDAPSRKADKEKTLLLFNIKSIDDAKRYIPIFTKAIDYLLNVV